MAEFGIHPFYQPDNATADLVLVHGLMGDSKGTWTGKSDDGKPTYWPEWIKALCPTTNIWLVDYDSSLNAWVQPAMPLDSIAGAVLMHAKDQGIGSRPIHWVGHSMGGLIIKHLLRQAREKAKSDWSQVSDASVAITFLGTPHHGADIAHWLTYFEVLLKACDVVALGGATTGFMSAIKGLVGGFAGTRQSHVKQLESHGRTLGNLNDSFAQWLGSADRAGRLSSVRNYFEELPVFKTVCVVPKHLATLSNAIVEEAGVPANHFDICKFSSPKSFVFEGLVTITRKCTVAAEPTSVATVKIPISVQEPVEPEPTNASDGGSSAGTQAQHDLTDIAWRRNLAACSSADQDLVRMRLQRARILPNALQGIVLEAAISQALQTGNKPELIGRLQACLQPDSGRGEASENVVGLLLMLLIRANALSAIAYVNGHRVGGLCVPDDVNKLAVVVAAHVVFGQGVQISHTGHGWEVENLVDMEALPNVEARHPSQIAEQSPIRVEIKRWLERHDNKSLTDASSARLKAFIEASEGGVAVKPLVLDRLGLLTEQTLKALLDDLGIGAVQLAKDGRPAHIDANRWNDLCEGLTLRLHRARLSGAQTGPAQENTFAAAVPT